MELCVEAGQEIVEEIDSGRRNDEAFSGRKSPSK